MSFSINWGQARQEERQETFKKAFSVDDGRRKREEKSLRIRKNKREQSLAKRRNITRMVPSANMVKETPSSQNGKIAESMQYLRNNDPKVQLQGTRTLRKLLSQEQNPPISQVLDAGALEAFIVFLKRQDQAELQFEAAWCLTNIASGSSKQCRAVVQAGAMPLFLQCIATGNADVADQCIWAIGNIAGDCCEFRDLALQNNAIAIILGAMKKSNDISKLRNIVWTISNLCRGKPQPNFAWVRPALPALSNMLTSSDNEILTDALWALSYLTDGPNERIQEIIEAGVCRRIVEYLRHANDKIRTPALRACGNIVTGDDTQTGIMLNLGVLGCLRDCLSAKKKSMRKEAMWALSNIAAGNASQIHALEAANLFPVIIDMLDKDDFDIKKEAAWTISNATSGGSKDQIRMLVREGAISPLCELLGAADAKIITVGLDALGNILKVGASDAKFNGVNQFADLIEECEGLDKLEELQVHQNIDIYEKSVKLLEKYFAAEEEDQNLAPNVDQSTGAFTFGAPVAQNGNGNNGGFGGFTFT